MTTYTAASSAFVEAAKTIEAIEPTEAAKLPDVTRGGVILISKGVALAGV